MPVEHEFVCCMCFTGVFFSFLLLWRYLPILIWFVWQDQVKHKSSKNYKEKKENCRLVIASLVCVFYLALCSRMFVSIVVLWQITIIVFEPRGSVLWGLSMYL